jgi:hypothetical protein
VNQLEKKAGIIVTDRYLQDVQMLPGGSEFLRWLGPETILLRGAGSLISHRLTGGPDRAFHVPVGWQGTVIPNTSVRVLLSSEGKLAVQQDDESPREVLKGVAGLRDAAVANDLTVFGGVDSEGQLWIQRGFAAEPEVAGKGVRQAVWGPISHQALIQGVDGESRVYWAQADRWKNLGTITAAQWSSNEKQLLVVESVRKGSEMTPTFLSVFADDRIIRLCPFERIGQLAQMQITENGREALLLASLTGGLDVWMTELPRVEEPAKALSPPK